MPVGQDNLWSRFLRILGIGMFWLVVGLFTLWASAAL